MALYGIFLIVLIPLLPALAALTAHPLLDILESRRQPQPTASSAALAS